ncbi:sugar phosphate isomerase/epimerase family protein [Halovenus marina]|uniref:sugar phosphate isomerase/epimerase family protein n=1 Tax=Halovenus marina TaxID=3396621 RepID=UPI003F56A231
MMRPAIQLHSVRDLEVTLPTALEYVSDAGFEGVEFAGRFADADPDAVAATLDETGLVPVGGHVEFSALKSDPGPIMDRFETIGCSQLVIPHVPATHFRTKRRTRAFADTLTEIATTLEQRGFDLVYHNTRHDLFPPLNYPLLGRLVDAGVVPGAVDGLVFEPLRLRQTATQMRDTGIGYLFECTAGANIGFEIDAGEVRAANHDQNEVYEFFGDRLTAIHVCDVTDSSDGYQSTDPGTGVLDYERVFSAATRSDVEWLIYEHDHPEDAMATIQHGADAVVEPLRAQAIA